MKKHGRLLLSEGLGAILGFILWTLLVKSVDVQAIGPQESEVGFATLNKHLHDLIGTNMTLYVITDWLGLVPIGVALGFALFGIFQLWKRKSIFKVDKSILALGVFYITVAAVYIFFEMVVINYRPILIDGILEASYPSSTTMLVLCVMPTAAMQFYNRIKNNTLRFCVIIAIALFITFTVVGRILSGVHWITDIIGGILFSLGAVMIYGYFLRNN
jgi:undecaprenyl-diphosphatase